MSFTLTPGPESKRETLRSSGTFHALQLNFHFPRLTAVGILSRFIKTCRPISGTFPLAITSWRQMELLLTLKCKKVLEMVVIR